MTLVARVIMLAVLAASAADLSFDRFPAAQTFSGKRAAPNLSSHPKARTFRTELRRQALHGPDFAGHYTIVRLGCGTGCAMLAVIDASSGRVFFPEGLWRVQWDGWWHEQFGPDYRITSRLMIVRGKANEDGEYGTSYFEWTGEDFRLIRFIPQDRGRPPEG